MENLEFYERARVVPEEAKKEIKAGRLKGFTDINPMWRIKKLTELFGPCGIGWYVSIDKQWVEQVGNEICAFVNISLYVRCGEEWSKPIAGTGGSKLATQEKSGIYVSDECYKMAYTDALSVACKALGIGADVYFSADRTKYDAPPAPAKITEDQLKQIFAEMDRTGVTDGKLRYYYKLKNLADMNAEQFENCMANFANTPSQIPPEQVEEASSEAPFK